MICDFGSRVFSLVHTISDARVPCMCPRGPWRALVRVDGFTDDHRSPSSVLSDVVLRRPGATEVLGSSRVCPTRHAVVPSYKSGWISAAAVPQERQSDHEEADDQDSESGCSRERTAVLQDRGGDRVSAEPGQDPRAYADEQRHHCLTGTRKRPSKASRSGRMASVASPGAVLLSRHLLVGHLPAGKVPDSLLLWLLRSRDWIVTFTLCNR
jgi:hypothetical protein